MEKEEKRADQENDTEEQSTEAKSLLKKKLQYYSSEIQRDVGNLVKWLMIAVLVGCSTGAASTLFSFVLKSVTNCRKENEWMFYLLPVMGLIIVYLYEKFGKDDGGTNQVLSTVRSQDDVPILSAPLIFISTALTHLAGGSAGREGAAIQLGGSIANQLGRWIHLDGRPTCNCYVWYECSILCIVWNTDGCGCFCTGGSQCRSDVLYSFDALYDCFPGCIWICGRNGSYTGDFSCSGYSEADY